MTGESSGSSARRPGGGRSAVRFIRYSSLSLLTVPAGYALLLLARHFWDVNAGLLNLAVGTVLTLPSYLLYRGLVWREHTGQSQLRELLGFWQTVMIGALASSMLIGLTDALAAGNPPLIVLAGLTGQSIIFFARFFWLDTVTFSPGHRRRP